MRPRPKTNFVSGAQARVLGAMANATAPVTATQLGAALRYNRTVPQKLERLGVTDMRSFAAGGVLWHLARAGMVICVRKGKPWHPASRKGKGSPGLPALWALTELGIYSLFNWEQEFGYLPDTIVPPHPYSGKASREIK